MFYPSHLLLLFLPAACLLPFHCLLVFGQSIPEKKGKLKKKKKKRGGGRQSKPFELLPVLSEVSGGRGSMQVHKRFLDSLQLLYFPNHTHTPPFINTIEILTLWIFLPFRKEDSYLFWQKEEESIIFWFCVQKARIFCVENWCSSNQFLCVKNWCSSNQFLCVCAYKGCCVCVCMCI